MEIPTAILQQLVDVASTARSRAHCPYSGFAVGASLWTGRGEIVGGCNVENASYGATVCAERVAVTRALAAGHSSFLALCVVSLQNAAPCGICRQFLAEFCDDLPILLVDADQTDQVRRTNLVDLLPEPFRL